MSLSEGYGEFGPKIQQEEDDDERGILHSIICYANLE